MSRIIGVGVVALSVITVAPRLAAQQFSLMTEGGMSASPYSKNIGTRRVFICRPNVVITRIWGTDVYSADSPICTAAVHAGVITQAQGGLVTIVIGEGAASYPGSTRNGVTSVAWTTPHERSYTFDRANGIPHGLIDWPTSATRLPPDFHTPIDLTCPPTDAKVLADLAPVNGSDIYTDDSPICAAAVHVGLITFGGGVVHFISKGPQKSFASATRNGVTSRSYGAWDGSFSLAPAPGRTADVSGPSSTPTRDRGFVPKSFTVTVTSGTSGPVVTWPVVAQATGYAVSRWKIDDNCCDNTSGRSYTAVSPWQDAPLPVSGTYVYRVVANTPAGDVYGETQFGFRKPGDAAIATSPTSSPTTVTPVLVSPTPTTGTITPMPAGTTTTSPTGTLVTERPATGATSAAGPPPTNLRFTGVPPIVRIAWDPPAGVASYNLSWKRAGAANWTVSPKPLPGYFTSFDFRIEDPSVVYSYQVTAYQPDNRFGSVSGDFAPTALEPTNLKATATGPGKVRFEWDNIQTQFPAYFQNNQPTTYLLAGPGTGTGIMVVGSSTSVTQKNMYELQDVPAGTQTWTLTPAWPAVISPSTSWAKATATVPAIASDPLPRYRLVALGFKAIQQSKDIDDAHDGHGDEVYLSAIVNRTQLTGIPLPVTKGANVTMVMTRSHGDEAVSVPYGRIKAGTASPTGGIKTGDVVPASLDLAAPTGAFQNLTFPLLLWEGTLGDSDAVIVHPTLWEDEVNPIVQATWAKTIFDAAATGYAATGTVQPDRTAVEIRTVTTDQCVLLSSCNGCFYLPGDLKMCSPDYPTLAVFDGMAGSPIVECSFYREGDVPGPCAAHGVDRPLVNWSTKLEDRLIILARARVERAIQSSPAHPEWRPGTFVMRFDAHMLSELAANYELYLRVERVP